GQVFGLMVHALDRGIVSCDPTRQFGQLFGYRRVYSGKFLRDRVPLSAGAALYLAWRPLAEPPHGLKHAVAPVGAPQSAMEAAVTAVGQYESGAVWAPLDIAARSLCRRDCHLAAGQDQGERLRGVSWRNGFSSRTISAVRDSSTGDAAVGALGQL